MKRRGPAGTADVQKTHHPEDPSSLWKSSFNNIFNYLNLFQYSFTVSIQQMLHVIQIYPNGARAISIDCQKSCFVKHFSRRGGRPEGSAGIRTGSGDLPLAAVVLIRVFSPLVTLTLSENHVIDQRRQYACSQFWFFFSLFKIGRRTKAPR